MSPIGIATSRSNQVKQKDAAKLWLLLVGVNQYQDEALPSLRYSAVDCQGLAEALADPALGKFQEVKIHHDFAPQLPLLTTVRASLKQITTVAKSIDTVIFYFSGHGILQPNTQQAFLCLADTQKSHLETTGLALQELLQALSNCAAHQQLVWLDACHSGGMTLRGTGESLPNPTPQLVQVLQQRAATAKGFYALLSCDTNQQSWEFPELGHGVFTYYLMRGLRGDAADGNSIISADSLYRYVYHQTLQYIDKTNQQLRLINQQKRSKGETQLFHEYPLQTPKRIVEGVGELILARRRDAALAQHRVGVVIEGLSSNQTGLDISKLFGFAGVELEYLLAAKATAEQMREVITRKVHSLSADTILLYLRGRIEETEDWEGLVLGDIRIKRSWLKQQLRHTTAKQIIILDCPGRTASLQDWVEDLQIDSPQGQCIIASAATIAAPEKFAQTLLNTLKIASPTDGLSAAGAIAQLQLALAGTGIPIQVWLSGTQGIIEILPAKTDLPGRQTQGLDLGICPYMGLSAFAEEDCQYFYGRESLTQELIHELRDRSFLAIVGASGSGKSSVMQAGVIPQLRLGKQIPSSEQWLIINLRPGANPLFTLSQKLGGVESSPSPLLIEGILHQGVEGFVYWLRRLPHPVIVLAIDQFEELFSLATTTDRERFLELVFGAVEYAKDRFKLIITLRADFIAAALEVSALAQALQQSSVLVPPRLSLDDYRRVIVNPAQQVGLKVESELVEVLLRELDHSVGDLPLLEFVLEQLWQHRTQGELTIEAYQQQLGGIQGALERCSQALYESLDSAAQECAKWIFLSLTQLGEGTEDTRRRIYKSELIVKKYPPALVERTLQALTAAKLIVMNLAEAETQEATNKGKTEPPLPQSPTPPLPLLPAVTVEVAHEILIRHWSTLRWWLEENRSRLRSQRQIEQAAQLWLQGHSPDFLLQGVRLAEAEDIYIKYTDELSDDVQQFIAACLAERQRQQFQEKSRLRQAQRAVVALSILGIAACSFAGLAYWQGRETQLREIEALNSSSQANLLSHQQLEALIAGVKAGKQLQKTIAVPANVKSTVIQSLSQIFSLLQEHNRLSKHSEAVISAVFSPDGQTIASASLDGSIVVWGRDGRLFRTLQGHDAGVYNVSFSPDSQIIASSSADKTIKLWRRNDGKLLSTLQGHQAEVNSSSFAPDGKILASASKDGTIKLWKLDGSLLNTLKGHSAGVISVMFSPQGNLIVSASEDKTVKIWRTDGTLLTTLIGHEDWVNSASFSPDRKTIISASADKTIKLWRVSDGQLLNTLKGHDGSVTGASFSPDSQTIVSGSKDNTVKLWSHDGTELQTFQGHSAAVESVGFSPDGKTIVSASRDGRIELWIPRDDALLLTLKGHSAGVFSTSFSPDGKTIISAAADNTLKIWNLSGILLSTLKGHSAGVYGVSLSADGNIIASASADHTLKLWRSRDGQLLSTLRGHGAEVNSVSFAPDDKTIASASDDHTVKIWRSRDGQLLQTLKGHTAEVLNVHFAPDGQTIASASADRTIKIWRSQDGMLLRTLTGHQNWVNGVIFSPDGKTIVSASADKTLKFWRSRDGQLIRTLSGHTAEVSSISFAPDGKTIASGSADQTIKIWRSRDGMLLQTLKGHSAGVNSVNFAPTGNLITSASADSTLKLWRFHPSQLQTDDLNQLLVRSCHWLHDYLSNPQFNDQEQHLCAEFDRYHHHREDQVHPLVVHSILPDELSRLD